VNRSRRPFWTEIEIFADAGISIAGIEDKFLRTFNIIFTPWNRKGELKRKGRTGICRCDFEETLHARKP
jgi:hypothetical protein